MLKNHPELRTMLSQGGCWFLSRMPYLPIPEGVTTREQYRHLTRRRTILPSISLDRILHVIALILLAALWAKGQTPTARATAAAPTHTEKAMVPLSVDLTGALRTSGGGGAGGGLTDAQLRATPVPVSGTFWQATQPVSGTFWQATQPVSGTVTANAGTGTFAVSGPLTDTQLRATPVPVSGTFWQATQPVSGTFWQATQPVSGTFWQATQPVAGTKTNNNAAPGATNVGTLPAVATAAAPSHTEGNQVGLSTDLAGNMRITTVDRSTSGTAGSLNAFVDLSGLNGVSSGTLTITGTWTGTLTFQASSDGTTYSTIVGINPSGGIAGVGVTTTTTNGLFIIPAGSFSNIRVTMTAYTSGTANIGIRAGAGSNNFSVVTGTIFPLGSNLAGLQQAVTTNALMVGGTAANNAAITQHPILAGVEVLSSQPTAATTGNQRRLVGSLDGALYVRQGGPITWTCSLDAIAASLTQCQATPGAGLRLYVTDIVANSTTATAGQMLLRRGTGTNCGTGTASVFPSAATVVRLPYPANTVIPLVINLETPLAITADNALCVLAVATNTLSITISGYTAP